jgi:serine/threonine protein phosphatase 1
MKILRLPQNKEGRDFVCGDIHGSYSCVTKALEGLKFDKSIDRLICAGDLVDRGPSNEACLDLLYQTWFFCCKGNHEQLMEEYFAQQHYGQWWAPNGGNWGTKYLTEISPMAHFVRTTVKNINELPYLITVEKKDGGIFHVLHAELPPFWKEKITDETLADSEKFAALATQTTQDGDVITWGRYIFYSLYKASLDERAIRKYTKQAEMHKFASVFNDELSHIYSGHTIMRRPVRFVGQTNLDTCAYGSYYHPTTYNDGTPDDWCGLTITEPATDKFWLVNDRAFKEVQPVIIEPLSPKKRTSIELSEEHD